MLASKLPGTGTTIFAHMSQLAAETGAINLSQGFVDFDPPSGLLNALARWAVSSQHQYTPLAGVAALREQIAGNIQRLYRRSLSVDNEITVTPGATEAIFCAVQALVRPGDEVILFDPCYDSYEPAVTLAGGRCVHLPLTLPDFAIDWQRLADAIGPKTRLIIINSPHNPSGTMLTRADQDQLAALIANRDIYLISDEVYEYLVFDGQSHASVVSHDELYAKALVVSSFGKTYHVTGWKTGYVVAPPALTAELRRIHQYVCYCGVTPVQYALAEFMAENPRHVDELPGFYQAKRDLFCELLQGSALRLRPSSGTYFQLADYSAIRPDLDDVQMSQWLAREHGVATIPISVFYQSPPPDLRYLRFCFAKREETLRQAAAKLTQV